ncbi:MAG: ABC transporter permease [Hyphomicrobiaceae bacterium]|nr:ABC transporter permease [Hyphomicrobiaceae bacterium]
MSQSSTESTASGNKTGGSARDREGFSLAKFGSAYFLLGVLILLFLVFSWLAPHSFPTPFNMQTMGTGKSIVALLALAVMVPIAANEFDLSVGYGIGLFHILTMGLMVFSGLPWFVAVPVVLLAGALLGLVNGLLVAWAKISSFIATLGTGTVIYGLSQWYSGGLQIVSPTPLPREFLGLTSVIYGVPWPVIVVLVVAVAMWICAEYLPVGRYLYVTGANRRAAELMGIPTGRYVVGSFIVSGVLTALAGVFLASQLRIGQGGTGPEFLLPAFAAALLGATAVRPGRVNVWGTVTAVAVLAVGVSGLQQLGAVFYVDPLFSGTTLILSVGLAGWVGRRTANRTSAASKLIRQRQENATPAKSGETA